MELIVYRDERYAARCRAPQVQQGLRFDVPWLVQRLYAERQARIWAAGSGLVGFAALLIDILFGAAHLSQVLVLTWGNVILTYCLTWLVAGEVLRGRTRRTFTPTGDPLADLIRIEGGDARSYAVERVRRLEKLSLILPLVSLSLLAPLSLHLLIGVALLGVSIDQFNSWILLSLVLVGHAHACLVVFSVRHVAVVRGALDSGACPPGGSRGALALLWTVAISTVPGALLLFIPPVLVAATGALFIPVMFHWAARRASAERRSLATLEAL